MIKFAVINLKKQNIKTMKKLATLFILALLAAAEAGAQVLYKVSGNGLEKPSYVVGTMHLANTSFVEKIAGVKDAIIATNQVYGEVKWDDMTNMDSLMVMQQKMLLPEGQTLKTVLNAEQYAKLDAFVKKTMGVGMDNPQVFAQLGKATPGTLTTQFELLLYMQAHMGEFDPTNTIDQYFQAQAKKNNEPVGGLETLSFQGNLLYASTPMERQITQLMCLLNNEEYYTGLMDRMAEAYYAQDIEKLKEVMNEKFDATCDATPEEQDALIYNRNADWARKMPAIMAEKPTLFVVGAGHLPGEKGVLTLLKNAGYTVESVK